MLPPEGTGIGMTATGSRVLLTSCADLAEPEPHFLDPLPMWLWVRAGHKRTLHENQKAAMTQWPSCDEGVMIRGGERCSASKIGLSLLPPHPLAPQPPAGTDACSALDSCVCPPTQCLPAAPGLLPHLLTPSFWSFTCKAPPAVLSVTSSFYNTQVMSAPLSES